jgi:hypothetical protein
MGAKRAAFTPSGTVMNARRAAFTPRSTIVNARADVLEHKSASVTLNRVLLEHKTRTPAAERGIADAKGRIIDAEDTVPDAQSLIPLPQIAGHCARGAHPSCTIRASLLRTDTSLRESETPIAAKAMRHGVSGVRVSIK